MASIDKFGEKCCEGTKNSFASIEVLHGDMDDCEESWVGSSARKDDFEV